ncbi:MAG: hypothetical protein ACRCZI_13910 [Cetobacterium sp.]
MFRIQAFTEIFSNLDIESQVELEKLIFKINGFKFIVTHDYKFKSNEKYKILNL